MQGGGGALTLDCMTIPDPERGPRPGYEAPGYEAPGYEVHEEIEDSRAGRIRAVRMVCSVITFITVLFAVVLVAHIILVLAEANPKNGFASFVSSWASGVSLGLHNLFTPDAAKLRTFLNDGTAAILWLLIGAALNFLIRRFTLPGPRRSVDYRRTIE
ncbi:hypothetical protein EV186_103527 [Labedaea rhizosphaerae]|uniref:Uncharacterized protein n=2 Tax=Labedaea rhizosphaerae TaxID=598644 RepID=A0A4R6SD76_LABRH|nr:hypothetical protein EV186_103527 [Labedaea rhizosphaerae]